MKKTFNLITILGVLLMFSCSREDKQEEEVSNDECVRVKTEFVSSINAPSEGKVGETIAIDVNFPVYNSCGNFGEFIESGSQTSKVIEVEARYKGCACYQAISVETVRYEFTPETPGVYELKFKAGENDFLSIEIDIS